LNFKFRRRYTHFNDSSDKNEFKKILNYFISDFQLQTKILDNLLKKFKIKLNYKNIYLSNKEINLMKDMGMIIASHGHTHRLLSNLDYKNQKEEILSSINFLKKKFKINTNYFCYPYGGKISYNTNTIKILKKCNILKAFSVGNKNIKNLNIKKYNYEIPRYDCNKFI
jgi:peptidoglycan/xylan/chitin deacetylase (PgdA/CDA1 family)